MADLNTYSKFCPNCNESKDFLHITTNIYGCTVCDNTYEDQRLKEAFLTARRNTFTSNFEFDNINEIIAKVTEHNANYKNSTTLPTDSEERKGYPLFRGCLRYFSAALASVSRISKIGNDKHNPGEEMYHARGKSMDHGDCILRHLIDVEDLLAARARGNTKITDRQILDEAGQLTWRALAYSQELHEKLGAPLASGARGANVSK